MGCGGSISPSPAHRLLMLAYEDKASVNTLKLRAAVNNLNASQLDARDSHYGWSALSLAALMDQHTNCDAAASILLEAGADPFNGGEGLYDTPIGRCVKYNNTKVLGRILQKLDTEGWKKFIYLLSQPPEVYTKASHVPEGTWVLVQGRKGKTSMQYGASSRGTHLPALSNTITFEDGSSQALGPEKVTVIPQAPSQVLQMIHNIAVDKGCSPKHLERLKFVEEADRKIHGAFRKNFFGLGLAVMGGA